ncbi:helix-turn-helix domain-containing protein [Shewanella colwelliana]|uniref:DNA-binding protein n=1 Tax=Shewanella colwelliana TaxID=23 RepID=A0A1E5IWJ0_SHECO|nr:helix-turn-helix domain-containing protein [Shewanella colwelliana]MCZ4338967.1 helix-turn-helix domain-containing protein [Shewanella colwelliana]MDX1283209.1 helix-turn-helix domain-containing protein [Shewanella colwelliana]OEG74922.1 DNA-binding protein [Shewanella colwelliana]GIU24475.1 DNA-binding protein [Shewanella colwelliana]GIU37008.1 DNA-binding protein [Shewanella colwelliana]
MSDKQLTLEQVCEILNKTPTTIKRYARENLLTNVGEDDNYLFNEAEVMRYLEFSKRLG